MDSEPTPVKGFTSFSLTTGARPWLSRGHRLCLSPLARFFPLPHGLEAAVTVRELMVLPRDLVLALADTYLVFLAGLGRSLEEDVRRCISPSDTGINVFSIHDSELF